MNRVIEKVLTDNTNEKITVKWDGERFAITRWNKDVYSAPDTIIFNPQEMFNLMEFVKLVRR